MLPSETLQHKLDYYYTAYNRNLSFGKSMEFSKNMKRYSQMPDSWSKINFDRFSTGIIEFLLLISYMYLENISQLILTQKQNVFEKSIEGFNSRKLMEKNWKAPEIVKKKQYFLFHNSRIKTRKLESPLTLTNINLSPLKSNLRLKLQQVGASFITLD